MLIRLDSTLLKAAQWVVDKIGGDYLGQRISLQLAYAACIGIMILTAANHQYPVGAVTFCLLVWSLILWGYHPYVKRLIAILRGGFANPQRGNWMGRLLNMWLFICLYVVPVCRHPTFFTTGEMVAYSLLVASFYFSSTENPPPKKAEAKVKEDVTLLNSAPHSL